MIFPRAHVLTPVVPHIDTQIHFPRDKLNNLVLFDKGTYDKLYKEVPTYKLITPSIVSERLKVIFNFQSNADVHHDANITYII